MSGAAGSAVPPPADQPARTSLAWSRTALGFIAVGALVGRWAWIDGSASLVIAAVTVAVLVVGVAAMRRERLRRFAGGPGRSSPGGGVAAGLVAPAVAVLAALAVVLILSA